MNKKCTNITAVWNQTNEPEGFKIPEGENVLSYTVFNKGTGKILIDETEELEQGEYYPVAHHVGYYFTGIVRIKSLTTDQPKVHIRMTVESVI
jgi:hypothetical protein